MGIVTMGVPREIILELACLNNSTIFIETGTFLGDTTRWAAEYFKAVHTIESAENLYRLHSPKLDQITGVKTYLGDSRDVLPQIVQDLHHEKAVFWLDGHWSGGETYGEKDECPILGELDALVNRTQDIILIDDARLFLSAPPLPHDPAQWATVFDIFGKISSNGESFVQIIDDVIFIIPNETKLKNCLVAYAQRRANDFWAEFGKLQRGKSSFKNRLLNRLSRIKNG